MQICQLLKRKRESLTNHPRFTFTRVKSEFLSSSMRRGMRASDPKLVVLAAAVAVLIHIHISSATYSCCSEERRGTVCTLAGNGAASSIDSPNASTAAFYSPGAIVMYPPHGIIVGGYSENRLRIIHDNGTVSTLAGGGPIGADPGSNVDSDDPLAARFWVPAGLCIASDGSILLCDCYNHRIRTMLRNGSVRTLAGSGTTGYNNGGYADNANPLQARFFHPYGIVSIVENSQRLIVIGGHHDHRIRVIYANMTVSTLAGSGNIGYMNCDFKDSVNPLAARLCHPVGLVQERHGNIVVAEQFSGRLRKLWLDGSCRGVTTIAGKGPIGDTGGSSVDSDNPLEASFFTPTNVAIDGAGNILVACAYEHRVRIILINGSVRTLAGTGPTSGLAAGTLGGFLDNVPVLQAHFNIPHFAEIDIGGNVIVSEFAGRRIRMLCLNLQVAGTGTASQSSTTTRNDSRSASSSLPTGHATSPTCTATQTAATTQPLSATRHTVTATSSVPSPSMSPSQTHPLQLQPPAPNPISRLVSSEEAARAVVASGAAVAALAGIAAATSMGHATRMGALLRSVECAFTSLASLLPRRSSSCRFSGASSRKAARSDLTLAARS